MSADKDGPVLVVRGTGEDRVLLARIVGGVGLALLVVGTAAAGTLIFPAGVSRVGRVAARGLLLVPAALGAYLGERLLRPRAGSVAFYEVRIVISKQTREGLLHMGKTVEHTEQILWSELRGFRDDRSDHVVLVVERGTSSFLTVPTPREEDRVAVLKLLDDRGIKRLE
jgi:hypothetical protein